MGITQLGGPFISAMDTDNKGTEVVCVSIRYEITEGVVGFARLFFHLLAQGMEGGIVLWQNDVVTICFGRVKTIDAFGGETFAFYDALEKFLSIKVELIGNFGSFRVSCLEGFGFPIPDTSELPTVKEGGPVNVIDEFAQGLVLDDARAGEFWYGRMVRAPIDELFVGSCFYQADCCFVFFVKGRTELYVPLFVFTDEVTAALLAEQRGGDWHRARGVEHVNDRAGVMRCDLYRGVGWAGGSTTDEDGCAELTALHLLGNIDHFIKGWCDQSGKTDDVHLLGGGYLEDFFTGNHDAHINDFKAVACENHTNNVFADVVHVTFDGGHQDAASGH